MSVGKTPTTEIQFAAKSQRPVCPTEDTYGAVHVDRISDGKFHFRPHWPYRQNVTGNMNIIHDFVDYTEYFNYVKKMVVSQRFNSRGVSCFRSYPGRLVGRQKNKK